MSEPPGVESDEALPISVRLGEVVPPEDPEDWTRPLTWLAALGMLAGPLVALGWFVLAPPLQSDRPAPGTWLVAASLAAGAALTGATQLGASRALAGTLGAALFGALAMVILGVALAGQRQLGAASPTLVHAAVGALAGLAGALAVAAPSAALAVRLRRQARGAIVIPSAVAVSLLVVPLLLSPR